MAGTFTSTGPAGAAAAPSSWSCANVTTPTPPPAAPRRLLDRSLLEELLKRPPPRAREARVFVPCLEADILLRGLTGAERDAWEVGIYKALEAHELEVKSGAPRDTYILSRNLRARLVAACAADESGARVLATDEGVAFLAALPAEDLEPVYVVAERLSGVEPKAVERLVGESAGDRSSARGSDSPST